MKKKEFNIGQNFYTNTGKWLCTDIGSRTIIAIQLNQEDPESSNGPPYSTTECVFNEHDLYRCSPDLAEFEENHDEIFKSQKFIEIYDALMFVSSAGYGENSAILDKQTGTTYLRSYFCDMDEMEELADEDYDPAIHIDIPHKNDLDLGRNLVFKFVEQFIPDDYEKVERIFRKKGAYSRYKALLESRGELQQWYDFENKREQTALLEWCEENEIEL